MKIMIMVEVKNVKNLKELVVNLIVTLIVVNLVEIFVIIEKKVILVIKVLKVALMLKEVMMLISKLQSFLKHLKHV